MKIYDCFTFFNELDLLEIRLSELNDYVDYFVLVEARQTHSGKPKKLYYEENKPRYKKWKHKIIHVVVDLPKLNLLDKIIIKFSKKGSKTAAGLALSYGLGRWKLEWFQRKSIWKGLKKAKPEDIVMVSDLDEIPNPKKFNEAIYLAKKGKIVGFKQRTFSYYLNGRGKSDALSTKMCSYKTLNKRAGRNPQRLRIPSFWTRTKNKILGRKGYHGNIWNAELEVIENGGWHFSFLGGKDAIEEKLKNYPHMEKFSKRDKENFGKIEEYFRKNLFDKLGVRIVKIDKSFPKTVQNNKKKYSHLIK